MGNSGGKCADSTDENDSSKPLATKLVKKRVKLIIEDDPFFRDRKIIKPVVYYNEQDPEFQANFYECAMRKTMIEHAVDDHRAKAGNYSPQDFISHDSPEQQCPLFHTEIVKEKPKVMYGSARSINSEDYGIPIGERSPGQLSTGFEVNHRSSCPEHQNRGIQASPPKRCSDMEWTPKQQLFKKNPDVLASEASEQIADGNRMRAAGANPSKRQLLLQCALKPSVDLSRGAPYTSKGSSTSIASGNGATISLIGRTSSPRYGSEPCLKSTKSRRELVKFVNDRTRRLNRGSDKLYRGNPFD